MVHALLESWRVLQTDGIMIDLRPFNTNPALEIITADGIFVPGHINDSGSAPDDIASNNAIAEVIRQGRFTRVTPSRMVQDSFEFANYWDTLDGLLAHAEERWQDYACIPPFVLEAARMCITTAGSHYQIRMRKSIHIAVYRKQ